MIGLILYIAFLSVLVSLIVFILRQKGSYFRPFQMLFNTAFISFALIVSLDFVKNQLVKSQSQVFCIYATKTGISALMIAMFAIEHAAQILYQKKEEKPSWKLLFPKKNLHSVIPISYRAYGAFVLIITWIFTPWQTKLVMGMWGELVYAPIFELWYMAVLSGAAVAFLAYPCTLFILSSRKYKEKEVANALKWFGVCMIGVGCSIIVFHGLLRSLGFEMTEGDFLPNAVFFGIIAYFFKKTTILESLSESIYTTAYTPRPTGLIKNREVFSKALRLTHGQVVGKNILLEFDPTSNYEQVVEDFVDEALANAEPVAVFTSKGSVIHSALSKKDNVKFLVLTQRVSTPQVDTSENKILLPANNSSLLLDALNKVLKAYPERNSSIVFNNLSSLVLLNGLEKTYGFLRYALELLTLENGTSLFLFDPRAHDVKVASAFRSLFSNQITYGKEGLRVVKIPEPILKT